MSSNVLTRSNNTSGKPVKPVRESGIELLRILTICGVVVLHYNGTQAFSLVEANSFNYYILLVLEALFICAVNLFVLISGYFLALNGKRKAVKAIELVIQVIAMNVGIYLLSVLMGGGFSLRALAVAAIPNNYFVTLYLTVYLVSPYINVILNRLNDKQKGIFIGLCILLFSVWPTVLDSVSNITGLSLGGVYTTNTWGSQNGYSFINFALMYLLGAYLRHTNINFGKWTKIVMLLGCIAVLTLWQLWQAQVARSYNNPIVILCAVVVFLLFKDIKISSKVINSLAKGAFTCILLHGLFLPHIGIGRVINGNPLVLLVHILITVPLIFLICLGVWKIYDLLSRPVFNWLGKKLVVINNIISFEE